MWGNGLKWMFLIIGTMIGAGYASGRELWEFFGAESGLAIILFAILFIISVKVILNISYMNQSKHYLPVLQVLMGKRLSQMYDIMIIIYLFSTTVIMLAGGGATLEVIHIPYWLGTLIIGGLVVVLFLWDTKGMTSMNAFIIPILIVFLIAILVAFQYLKGFPIEFKIDAQHNWPSALTFTALNILPLIAVLGAIGHEIKHKGEMWIASLGSGIILGSISFLYNESLLQVASDIMLYEIPLFAILKHYPYFMMLIMSALLWLAIYTTAAAGVFGLLSRMRAWVKGPAWLIALFLIAIMAPLTTFGFSTLISILYPLYGVLNLFVLASILLYPIMNHKAL
ncbi:YkvI family membrane protein [Halalkalibacter okhensis]|uniref:Membrane protein n=1 Tax=Halalkalibacter okhensis TaxID=333138 RepID=A0A0B0IJ25_9BACI|nr:membrane protein [Halalkalibacter okhensis]KHF40069.1 membrane protein [Halalkalibacter okhensis]